MRDQTRTALEDTTKRLAEFFAKAEEASRATNELMVSESQLDDALFALAGELQIVLSAERLQRFISRLQDWGPNPR